MCSIVEIFVAVDLLKNAAPSPTPKNYSELFQKRSRLMEVRNETRKMFQGWGKELESIRIEKKVLMTTVTRLQAEIQDGKGEPEGLKFILRSQGRTQPPTRKREEGFCVQSDISYEYLAFVAKHFVITSDICRPVRCELDLFDVTVSFYWKHCAVVSACGMFLASDPLLGPFRGVSAIVSR